MRYIVGHFNFGSVAKHIDNKENDWLYFTMLRDPVERVISHYYHILRSPHSYLNDFLKSQNVSLEEYMNQRIHSSAFNAHVRYLCGNAREESAFTNFRAMTQEDLEQAKANLCTRFQIFGITERSMESFFLLKKVMGFKLFLFQKARVANNQQKKEIPESTKDIIRSNNQLDIELYKFACSRFENILQDYKINSEQVQQYEKNNSNLKILYKFQQRLYKTKAKITKKFSSK